MTGAARVALSDLPPFYTDGRGALAGEIAAASADVKGTRCGIIPLMAYDINWRRNLST